MSLLQLERVTASPWGMPLLEDIDLSLGSGEVLGIIGPNGAGKSSLLRVMSGDIETEAGAVRLHGQSIGDWPARTRACHLGVLPQQSSLNFPYSVEEVVALGRIPHDCGRSVDAAIISEALAAVDMLALRQRLYTELSGGERQRVQLARVLAQVWRSERALLLLDEPTSALDLAHQQQVLSVIRQLAGRGCAIVMVIHDFNLLAAHADRLLVLHRGRTASCGSPEQVLTTQLFRSVFDTEVHIGRHPGHGGPLVIST